MLYPILRPILQPILQPLMGARPRGGADSAFRAPFASGGKGLWIDQKDLTTQYEESTGITQAEINDTIGFAGDKARGFVVGGELVDTANTAAAWTPYGTNTVSNVTNGVAITFVNDARGALLQLNGAGGLSSNLTSGKSYKVTFDAVMNIGTATFSIVNFATNPSLTAASTTPTSYSFIGQGATFAPELAFNNLGAGEVLTITNISVKLLDGIHLSQATAANEPLLSARVNLLTYSEQFDNAAWTKPVGTITANAATAPDGTVTADKLFNAAGGIVRAEQTVAIPGALPISVSCHFETAGKGFAFIQINNSGTTAAAFVTVNLSTGAVGAITNLVGSFPGATASVTQAAEGFWRLQFNVTTNAGNSLISVGPCDSATDRASSAHASDGVYLWGAQLEYGSTATTYQRITTATDYDTTGFARYHRFDGTDDGLASATFAAGTLGADMDCFIAVRRNSAADMLFAMEVAGAPSKFFAAAASGGGGLATPIANGTPTHYVNGVAVPGGTATTRAQLHTAMTVGAWVILEIRNLDLSAWTAFALGNFGSGYDINGDIVGPILCEAQSADSRTAIRQALASRVGVTL